MSNDERRVDEDMEMASLADRLRYLIGNRSTRAAAKAWQLSYSTLNNYINRGTEPSLSVAAKIAELEGVSVEWLAWGDRDSTVTVLEDNTAVYEVKKPNDAAVDPLQFAWSMVFDALEKSEQEALLRLIHKEGVNGILHESDMRDALGHALSGLTSSERAQFYRQALELVETIKAATRK